MELDNVCPAVMTLWEVKLLQLRLPAPPGFTEDAAVAAVTRRRVSSRGGTWEARALFACWFVSLSALKSFLQTHITSEAWMRLYRFLAIDSQDLVDHRLQYHPSCDGIIISRMADSNSLHCHQPLPCTNINLHRKWKCSIGGARSHPTMEVIHL